MGDFSNARMLQSEYYTDEDPTFSALLFLLIAALSIVCNFLLLLVCFIYGPRVIRKHCCPKASTIRRQERNREELIRRAQIARRNDIYLIPDMENPGTEEGDSRSTAISQRQPGQGAVGTVAAQYLDDSVAFPNQTSLGVDSRTARDSTQSYVIGIIDSE